jgi:uncharacterized protein with GYD domain
MPKYLIAASYTSEGAKGVAKAGGTARKEAIEQLFAASGGQLEAFYFAFGPFDAYVFGDLPDNETAAAVALAVNSDGRATVTTTVLMTPEEVDAAAAKTVDYRGPGS